MKALLVNYGRKIREAIESRTGFRWGDATFANLVRCMYRPMDPASLGVSRMLFGLMMIFDGPEERGGAEVDLRWGDPMACHFPLIPLKVLTLPWMILTYAVMWIGAFGIALGYKFRVSSMMFAVPYWYIFLSEKSFWNNHSYLFGLIGMLLIGTQANNYLSLDCYMDKDTTKDRRVPYWNYFILKYQFFVMYFIAGLKKSSREWLSGYAMTNLGSHWVFSPFKIFLTDDQTDYFIVHWFAFVFDLTVGFWMMYEHTRTVAMLFCASFHLMNSRLFSIGMFPWVCLATMPLFCPPDWPRPVVAWLEENVFGRLAKKNKKLEDENIDEDDKKDEVSNEHDANEDVDDANKEKKIRRKSIENIQASDAGANVNWKKKLVVCLLMTHVGLQAFLPYSHFLTKGFNNWTNGLYGYSWDMMVNSWDTVLVLVRVVDKDSGAEMFLDPDAWVPNNRWTRHADMVHQYAGCLHRNLRQDLEDKRMLKELKRDVETTSYFEEEQNHQEEEEIGWTNVSIHVDVWCSMNGRFQQRMFDPNVDVLSARWSPFERVSWLLPLLAEFNGERDAMAEAHEAVRAWNDYTNVLFVADFPGLHLENYITADLFNVTLHVLEGRVFYEQFGRSTPPRDLSKSPGSERRPGKSSALHLGSGESCRVREGAFHRVHAVGDSPVSYMYVYMNRTKKELIEQSDGPSFEGFNNAKEKPMLPIVDELRSRLYNMGTFLQHIGNALLYVVYGVPMYRRVQLEMDHED